MRVAGLLAVFVALVASASGAATVLETRNCARMPNGVDPSVRDRIYLYALKRGVNHKVMVAMMATAIVETGVNNLDCGDKDSVGVFQQRPSQGWGTVEQIMNVEYSAGKFLDLCIQLDREFPNIDAGSLAMKVQRAEAGNKYTAQIDNAQRLIEQAEKSVGQNGPPATEPTNPRPTPTKTPTGGNNGGNNNGGGGGGSNGSSTEDPETSTPAPEAPRPTAPTKTVPGSSPPLATLWSPPSRIDSSNGRATNQQPSVVQVVLMPSAVVGRADPVRDAGDSDADRTAVAKCARAEYPAPGDRCIDFAARYKIDDQTLRKLNKAIDADCMNLDVHRAWCVESSS